MFSLCGTISQTLYNVVDATHLVSSSANHQSPESSFLQRMASKTWIPMKALSDAEYSQMLQEKLLQVEAEIVIIDESVSRLYIEKSNQIK